MPPLPDAINTSDDLSACAEVLFVLDKRFVELHRRNGQPRLRRRGGGLEGLAHIITGQLISIRAADVIWSRVEQALTPFEPSQVACMSVDELAKLGLTQAKAGSIISAAQAEHSGGFCFASLHRMDDDAAITCLTSLKGVGPWTADIYLMSCLGRLDAWPAGDLAVRAGLQAFEGLQGLPAIGAMHTHGARWRPVRSVAARYLWDHYSSQKE